MTFGADPDTVSHQLWSRAEIHFLLMHRRKPVNARRRIGFSEGGLVGLASVEQMFERDWSGIEQAYGKPLGAVRVRILTAICDFINEASIEQNAPLQTDVKDWLAGVRHIALKFKDVLTNRRALSDSDMRMVTVLLQEEIRSLDPQITLSTCQTMASKLAIACDQTLRKLGNSGFKEGDAWRNLIIALTRILGEARLPTGAPQSRDKAADDSVAPFVALVIAIQKVLSSDIRRHDRADPLSLAKEINRARKAVRDKLRRPRAGKMSRTASAGHKGPDDAT
jgi:hypothetical protein